MYSYITVALVLLTRPLFPVPSVAPDPSLGCKRNPAVIGDCFAVHGRLFVANGTPSLRMWPVGTKRHYGIIPAEAEIVPDNVRQHMAPSRAIFGDFVVCPFTVDQPGRMLMVCVQEAANLVIQEYDGRGNPSRLSYDRPRNEVP
jgi:hypothetical protein